MKLKAIILAIIICLIFSMSSWANWQYYIVTNLSSTTATAVGPYKFQPSQIVNVGITDYTSLLTDFTFYVNSGRLFVSGPYTNVVGTEPIKYHPHQGIVQGQDLGTVAWYNAPLAIAGGGTGQTTKISAFDTLSPMSALGDIVYGGASGTGTRLAGNTTATKKYLSQTGTGSASDIPVWDTITIPVTTPTAYIPLNIMQAVLWNDGSNNGVTVTSTHDNTNFCNYVRATSSIASQDIDLVIEFQIPTDFGSFPASCLSIDTRTSDKTNCACTISMYIAAGTVDAGINGAAITPTVANNIWYSFTDQPTGAYIAGDWVHIHIHISTGDGTPDTFDVARLTLKYTKA